MRSEETKAVILRTKCAKVEVQEEADIIISLLNNFIKEANTDYLAAPEANVMKKVAIVNLSSGTVSLINPEIICSGISAISVSEKCAAFPYTTFNCIRPSSITIKNGISGKVEKYSGKDAFIVSHAIDHLNGILCVDRLVKLGVVRDNGHIRLNELCPCGSKKKFTNCCRQK